MSTAIYRRSRVRGFSASSYLLASGLVSLGLAAPAMGAGKASDGDQTFKLRDVSVFEQRQDNFLRGQSALCGEKPFKEVKAYPAFVSKRPIYGSVHFSRDYKEGKTAQTVYLALDESKGTGKGYDRLYFDANHDLDLRNDPVLAPQQHPPEGALSRYSNIKQQVIFDCLSVNFDLGPAGTRPVEVLPRLTLSVYGTNEYRQMSFVRTRLWQGDVTIGGVEHVARLGNDYVIHGALDSPGTALVLSPKDKSGDRTYWWWGGDRLNAAHKVRDQFYTFSASATGDELTVHPYNGDLGTFEIGPGGRRLDTLTVSGSLEAKDRAVPVGGEVVDGSPREARRCHLPVGDYRPNYIRVGFGRLQVSMSFNYHSDGRAQGRGDQPAVYGITVRKDKPYVFDFSNKPAVMFASPAKGDRVKLGEELGVKAVLVDPRLDIMIRGLDDTSRKQTTTADGRSLGYERNVSLDPKVIITRLNGEKVAEGVMPFG